MMNNENIENVENVQEQVNTQPGKKKPNILIILLIVFALCGLGFFGWKKLSKDDNVVKPEVKEEKKIYKEDEVKKVKPSYVEGEDVDKAILKLFNSLEKNNGLYIYYTNSLYGFDYVNKLINDNKVLLALNISVGEINDVPFSSTGEGYQDYYKEIFKDEDVNMFTDYEPLGYEYNKKISYDEFIKNYYYLFGTKDVIIDKVDYGELDNYYYGYDKNTNMFYALSKRGGGGRADQYLFIVSIEEKDDELIVSYNYGTYDCFDDYGNYDNLTIYYNGDYISIEEAERNNEVVMTIEEKDKSKIDYSLFYNEETKDKLAINKVYFKKINGEYYIDRKE